MEIVDEKKKSNWKAIVTKLRKSKIKTKPKPKSNVPDFIDPKIGAQYYLDRYNNEQAYKDWFDENFPDYTIEEAIEIAIPDAFSKPELQSNVPLEEEKKINETDTENTDTENTDTENTDTENLDTENTDTQNITILQTELEKPNEATENNLLDYQTKRYLSIIKHLHQKEIGDFSRLESISNYLTDGKLLLFEDEQYLKDKFELYKEKTGTTEEFEYEESSVPNKDPDEPQTILIDEIESSPTNNFTSLGTTISKIIKNSTPHFTIGIYGEWGTGKTTLMKEIEKNLSTEGVFKTEQKILPVWFNAWQYDREENLATISLLKTVAYEMAGHEKFGAISKTILKGLTILGRGITQNLIQDLVAQKGFDDEEALDEKISQLNELYRESIYFDGIKRIKQQMEKIRKSAGRDYRVVIFIDDLDRCSPATALEILESIKLFLGMEGFIFVVGLSHKTVTELITGAYKATGVKGEDYIKKIIQIPIKIPVWSQENIIELIEHNIKQNLHEEYTTFLRQNSGMIARIVGNNPRQLKRFVNNVIIAFETFTNQKDSPKITFNEMFLVKILKAEWPDFYAELVQNKDFLEMVKWILKRPKELKKYFKFLNTASDDELAEKKQQRYIMLNKLAERTQGRIDSRAVEILSDFDYETWIFFNHIRDVLFGIKDWKVINNVMNIVEEIPYELPVGSSTVKKEPPAD